MFNAEMQVNAVNVKSLEELIEPIESSVC